MSPSTLPTSAKSSKSTPRNDCATLIPRIFTLIREGPTPHQRVRGGLLGSNLGNSSRLAHRIFATRPSVPTLVILSGVCAAKNPSSLSRVLA